jgi:hypothetical protein
MTNPHVIAWRKTEAGAHPQCGGPAISDCWGGSPETGFWTSKPPSFVATSCMRFTFALLSPNVRAPARQTINASTTTAKPLSLRNIIVHDRFCFAVMGNSENPALIGLADRRSAMLAALAFRPRRALRVQGSLELLAIAIYLGLGCHTPISHCLIPGPAPGGIPRETASDRVFAVVPATKVAGAYGLLRLRGGERTEGAGAKRGAREEGEHTVPRGPKRKISQNERRRDRIKQKQKDAIEFEKDPRHKAAREEGIDLHQCDAHPPCGICRCRGRDHPCARRGPTPPTCAPRSPAESWIGAMRSQRTR